METFFLVLFVLIILSYFLYPILLGISIIFSKRVVWREFKELPSVALIISVYNEEKVIERKILNSLELDYPNDKLTIHLVSDASDDNSDEIIKRYCINNPQLRLEILNKRSGKNAGINFALQSVKEDIVIFSDANSYYDIFALKNLVAPFENPQVGSVIGDLTFTHVLQKDISKNEAAYWALEKILKKYESRIGKVIIGNGSIISIRRELFEELPLDIANDLFLPVSIRNKGFEIVYQQNAKAFEKSTLKSSEEYQRKVRIITRGMTGLIKFLNKIKFSIWLQLFIRKALRWSVGFLLVFLFITNLFIYNLHFIYMLSLIIQISFYTLAFFYHIGLRNKITSIPFYYYLISLAGMKGIINGFIGKKYEIWKTPESSR